MRFRGLVLVGAFAFAGACGSPEEVVPTAGPSAASSEVGEDRPATTPTTAVPPDTDAAPTEPAPCITSGIEDDGSGFWPRSAEEEPALEEPALEEPAEEPPSSVSGFARRPAEEPGPLPDPTTLAWLAPEATPCGLVLREAKRDLGVDCERDCGTTVPAAFLRYGSDDGSMVRDVVVQQYLPASLGAIEFDPAGTLRTIAGRDVTLTEVDDEVVVASWAEPSGIYVDVHGRGVTADDLAVVVESLVAFEPEVWPGDEVIVPEPVCVDDTTRYAPTALPDGWDRFVLDIAPNGACNVAPFLFMSLTVPGTEAAPGTLVTFVIGPGGGSLPTGEVSEITIGDHPAILSEQIDANGRSLNTVVFRIGEITVDAHGSADVDTLIALAESVELVDVATWDLLTAEVQS